jgi:hypothetical protein
MAANGFDAPPAGWIKAIATVGLPSVLALVLTIFMIWTITNTHSAMAAQLAVVQLDVIANQTEIKDNGVQLRGVATLIRLNRQICLNTSADAQTRARCLEP